MNNLIIQSQQSNEPLSKSAKKFNQLLQRLEKAEKKLTQTKEMLDTKHVDALKLVLPPFDVWCKNKSDLIIELADYVVNNNVKKKQSEYIIAYIIQIFSEIRFSPHGISEEKKEALQKALSLLDPEFEDIFHEPAPGNAHDEDFREEKLNRTKEFIHAHFETMGIEIDLSDINTSMTDEEIQEALETKMDAVDPTIQQRKSKPRKKSKAQLKRETQKAEFNTMKDKSFASMYKNLVKLIHPDGETDEAIKQKKTEWMQQLTVAYKNKDIKTMMLIELEWLHGAKHELEKMSEDKLNHFNQLLSDQILETETREATLFADPRYYPLIYFANGAHNVKRFNPYQCRDAIKTSNLQDVANLISLRGDKKSAKSVITAIVNEMKELDEMEYEW